MRLAIVTTHPIQYYAPVFKLLQEGKLISIRVFYTWGENSIQRYDPGFGRNIKWDIPLLEGYSYEWVNNTASEPGSHHYTGIINPTLNTQIEDFKPDAVLIFGWAYKSHLKAIRYFRNKIPVYFRGDSTLLDEKKGFRQIVKKLFLSRIYRNVNRAFYVGTSNKAYFKKYGLQEDQLCFAPHAVDNNRFAEDRSAEVKVLKKSLKMNPDDILILFSGKLEPKKSPLLLLNAFLKAEIKNSHLLFAGNGVMEDELRANASAHDNIHLMGFQNQTYMPVLYQASSLFCLPSSGPGETWGLAVNEAMACRNAVLVSDKVGCAVDLVGCKNGFIFKSNDVDELANALKMLCADRKKLLQMGERSAEIIKHFTFTAIAGKIESQLMEDYDQKSHSNQKQN